MLPSSYSQSSLDSSLPALENNNLGLLLLRPPWVADAQVRYIYLFSHSCFHFYIATTLIIITEKRMEKWKKRKSKE